MDNRLKSYWGVLKIPGILFTLLLLFVPDEVFYETSLFQFTTPQIINYNWLESSASFLFFPFFMLVIKNNINKKVFFLFFFIISLFIWNLVKSYFVESFLMSNLNFELFYGLTIGVLLISYITRIVITSERLELFFEIFIYTQILGLLIGVVLDAGFDGRFHPPNLDVGTTGLFLGVFFVYLLFVKSKVNYIVIFLVFGCIILTGSRSNIILPFIFLFYFFINKIKKIMNLKNILIIGCLVFSIFIFFRNHLSLLSELEFMDLDRISALYEMATSGGVVDDNSFIGRIESIRVGLKVLNQNPLGVFFSFIDLQWNMQINGYDTFPHSSFLAFYLVFGPFFVVIVFRFLLIFYKLIKFQSNYSFVFLYIIIYSIFFGGLFVNFKIFFFYLLIFYLGLSTLKKRNDIN